MTCHPNRYSHPIRRSLLACEVAFNERSKTGRIRRLKQKAVLTNKKLLIRLLGGMANRRDIFLRHGSDVQYLQGDTPFCGTGPDVNTAGAAFDTNSTGKLDDFIRLPPVVFWTGRPIQK